MRTSFLYSALLFSILTAILSLKNQPIRDLPLYEQADHAAEAVDGAYQWRLPLLTGQPELKQIIILHIEPYSFRNKS